MNCQEFHAIVTDFAADGLMEAAIRSNAQAHLHECPPCAARLAQEKALRNGLHALAAVTSSADAPARVKGTLQAAFRERLGPPAPMQPVAPAQVMPFPTPNKPNRWLKWLPAAAAALLVLGSGLALLSVVSRPVTPGPVPVALDVKPALAPVVTPAVPTQNNPAEVHLNTSNHAPSVAKTGHFKRVTPKPTTPVTTPDRETTDTQTENATDFIPLTFIASSQSPETGQVVRIQVARNKLIAMGLPLNIERSSEFVTADVMLGDDGVARAIRVIQ